MRMDVVRGSIVPAVMGAYLAGYFALLPPLRSQSILFPRSVAITAIAVGLLIVGLESLRSCRRAERAVAERMRWRDPVILVALCIAYVPSFWLVGFIPASAGFLLAAMLLFAVPWRIALPVAAGTLLVVWAVFARLFGVPL